MENSKEIEANKFKGLEDLDVLSEHLIKENLSTPRLGSFHK